MRMKKVVVPALLYILIAGIFLSAAYWGSVATSALANRIPMERSVNIVIDPGHGGEDGGASSYSGIPESRFNLEISLKLRDLFHLLGYKTIMIRKTDRSVYTSGDTISARKNSDLRERTRIVNETEDALLISIHQNTFPERKYSGAQVFYGPKGEGQYLAEMLQTAFCSTVNPGSNRKCKKADGIYLMQHIDCTGILVECGFLSNPEEEIKLRSDSYQNKISCVIAATVAQFLTK